MPSPLSTVPQRGVCMAAVALACAWPPAHAATAAPPPAPAASAGTAAAAPARKASAAAAQWHVDEDDAVRIEELRIGGQTERLVVKPKWPGAREYEIVPPARGRDLSQSRGNVGQRVWSVLSF